MVSFFRILYAYNQERLNKRREERKKNMMYDAAVIGTGPAGVSAALTLQARKKNFIWFGSPLLSPKIRSAERIQNYPGLPAVSGDEMSAVFRKQIEEAGISVTDQTVTGVYPMGEHFGILCGQESYEARTVLLCLGVTTVKPLPGELEFVGRGVSYCATCDGALYRGKTIAVECTTKELEHEITFLAGLAEKVYLIPLYPDPAVSGENIEVLPRPPKEIAGGFRVDRLIFPDRELPVDGVFMLKDAVSPTVLLRDIETAEGHVLVDRQCRTSIPGCFAAGDCTGRPYQYAKAVGEGNVAAHSAIEYLFALEQKKKAENGG